MRSAVLTAALGLALLLAHPAAAQLQADVPGRQAPVEVLASPEAPTLSLGNLFNAQTLSLSHGYEYSYGAGAGGSLGLGVLTTSLRWQPSARLAGRVDLGLAHGATGSLAGAAGFSPDNPGRLFLRNAELAYRPTESSLIRLQVQQTPYGAACGYGGSVYGRAAYGVASGGCSSFGLQAQTGGDLFWRTDLGSGSE
jgi:hypothetical protein